MQRSRISLLCALMAVTVCAGVAYWQARPAEAAPKGGGNKDKKGGGKKNDKPDKKPAPKPAPQPAPPSGGGGKRDTAFSPQAVDAAINRAIKFLWTQQDKDGTWGEYGGGHKYHVGPTALVAYAMIESGVNPQDPRMSKAIDWMSQQKTEKTYELACRANAALAANRTTSDKYRSMLEKDALQLLRGCSAGHYNYDCNATIQQRWDNSNSQFGLLGVWAADLNRAEIPTTYWREVMRHWELCQNKDGGWGYRNEGDARASASRATMTVGGIASLFVCFDHVYAEQFMNCRMKFAYKPILAGLEWLDKNFPSTVRGSPNFYYLYGVERVGLASGYKYFGKSDWYKLGTELLLKAQGGNGGWGNVVNTAFSLLFLVRGRNPVVFNKLEYDGDWNNRPRDLANLTAWMSRTFERTVNWQIINLRVGVREWHDAPILYIAGSTAPKFTDADIKKLRQYVLQGGTILSITECGGAAFREGIRETYEKLFPGYPLTPLPEGHEIYTRKVYYDLPGGKPAMQMVSNGVRALALHCDADLPLSWQVRALATRLGNFQAAANIVRYVSESITSLRPRGYTHWPEEESFTPARTVQVARVRHAGNWNPEPLAYERFERLMAQQTRTKIEFKTVKVADLPGSGCSVALLTGTGKFPLLAMDKGPIEKFVASGGTLVIDAAGGSTQFAQGAEEFIRSVYGPREPRPLSTGADLYNLKGMSIREVDYRYQTRQRLGRTKLPNLKAVILKDRPAVLFSAEDLTFGLLGVNSFPVNGYTCESAFEIMRNIVLSAK
ncbi:MAG: hypothetical protein BWX88_05277 [Planctomycetes bacterium ADurb.Bin126]|nr:MAG: hypothetical protein BWX88_05277 [Planctomycetes bacterium ADurb.Bin126]HOD82776.1 DUF4159 domain-containing protein [Phycisphaerae bacterium]HQL75073.1 DUF4159 domain-containing protein [Phycisphaerae bacterium]